MDESYTALPAGELVEAGLADLAREVESLPALLVAIGAPRLRELGVPVPERSLAGPAGRRPARAGVHAGARRRGGSRRACLLHRAIALLKARGHARDRGDVSEILARGLVSVDELRRRFAEIEPLLHRFPAIDPASFRRGVEEAATAAEQWR